MFVAVWPPDDVLDAIAALPRPDVAGLRWTPPAQWHVTLRFLGECDTEAAVEAIGRLQTGPATAVVGPVTGRFGRRILQVPVGGLESVAPAVAVAAAAACAPVLA